MKQGLKFLILVFVFIGLQDSLKAQTIKIKDYNINIDSLKIHHISRLELDHNSISGFLLLQVSDNKRFIIIGEPQQNIDSETIFSDILISLYSISGEYLWSQKVENSGIGHVFISDDASITELRLGNDLLNQEFVLIIDKTGKILNRINNVNDFIGNKRGAFFTQKIADGKFIFGYYDIQTQKMSNKIFDVQVSIIANSLDSNFCVIKTSNKLYSYKGDSLLWLRDYPYGYVSISSTGKYILYSMDDSNILLIDNYRNKDILNYSKFINKNVSLSYAKFVINNDLYIAIVGDSLSYSIIDVFDFTGAKRYSGVINQCCLNGSFVLIADNSEELKLYVHGFFKSIIKIK